MKCFKCKWEHDCMEKECLVERYRRVTRDEIRRLREENDELKKFVRTCVALTNVGPEHHDVFLIGKPPFQIECIAMKGIK